MSEQEDSNLSNEVAGTTTKKKSKKKSKRPKNDEGDDDFIADFDSSDNRKKPKRKKKSTKPQSARSESSSAVDNKSEMSTKKKKKKKKTPKVDDDMNQDNDVEYTEDFNEQSSNYMYPRNHHEEDQSLPYSGSTMDSSMPPTKTYNDRGRNNGHPPPMHMESHNENGFIEYDDGDYMSEMGNMDPVDGYNQDYDMSEDDEEEPRFKYSTADLDDGDCRNTRCCLIAAGIFFILIAILVSVFMARLQNKDRRRLLTSIRSLRAALT